MKGFLKSIEANFEPIMMMVLFYVLLTLLTVQIILRNFVGGGFPWAEEVSRFMFVWLMYFAISYAVRNQRHIKVRFFAKLFGEKIEKCIAILSDVFFLLFSVVMFVSTTKLVQDVQQFGDRAISLNISMNFLYVAGLIGLLLMTVRVLQGIMWKINHFNESIDVFENVMGVYYDDSHLLPLLRNKDEAESEDNLRKRGVAD